MVTLPTNLVIVFGNAVVLITQEGSEINSSSVGDWFIPSLFVVLAGLIFWFMRDKFSGLGDADKRIEGKLDKNFSYILKQTRSIDRRVSRIEGHLNLSTMKTKSPITLSDIGKRILEESGIGKMADGFKDELLERIREYDTTTAYDIQKATRRIFQEFDFGQDNFKKLKNYLFESGEWGLGDVLDVGAIYFRDTALKEFGFQVEDLNKKQPKQKKQRQ